MNVGKETIKLGCLLLLAGMIAGCTKTDNETPHAVAITLSADKNQLKSDGNDIVTFAVNADGSDVSASAKLFYKTAGNMSFELSGKSFSTNIPGAYLFYATYDDLTSQEIEIEAMAAVLLFNVDTDTIKADGKSYITFTITVDGEDVSNRVEIFRKNGDSDIPLENNIFSTTKEGTYEFYCVYNDQLSRSITITAVPIVLTFSADVSSLKANGKESVTFTITADGEEVSTMGDIFRKNDDADILLENNIFVPDEEGTYEFYCVYNDQLSESITITAVPFVLTLRADVSSIKANGKESITFSVREDDNDITNEAEIFLKTGDGDILIENHMFSTLKEGHYTFYARYLHQTSDTLDIEAVISILTLSSKKTELITGETITFTAILDESLDVSNEVMLHITADNQTTTIQGPAFTPSSYGSYSIYATYDDMESNIIQIKVSPKIVKLSADKTSILSTGADRATFTVYVDDNRMEDATIYLMNTEGDSKLSDGTFSSNLAGSYSFYAQVEDVKSEIITIQVTFVNFKRQTCAMAFVATWCGFSPEMMEVFNQVRNLYSDQIQVISIHRTTSALASTDIVPEDFLDEKGITYTPYGIMDFRDEFIRIVSRIYQTHRNIVQNHPAKSGIAITSQIIDNNIRVNLRIKVNETNEYGVGAIIVEDGVVTRQVIYYNNSNEDYEWKDNFVANSVATYMMPGTKLQTGKPLGTLRAGQEVTESFSIPTNKPVTSGGRKVNHANCRVVAYVFRKEGDKYFINNVTTCPVNGSVDYLYEK